MQQMADKEVAMAIQPHKKFLEDYGGKCAEIIEIQTNFPRVNNLAL